jgi:multidrug efflux pump subunit AcrA (membrane-fusion protein)
LNIAIAIRLWVLVLSALAATTACNRTQAETARAAAPPAAPAVTVRPIVVNVAAAQSRSVQRTVETSGSVLAADEVQAKSEQPGTLARLRVDLGDRVDAGAVLADYDRREFQLAVDQAEADLAAVQQALARAQATAVASEAALRRTRDSRPVLEAEVARTQSQFEFMRSEMERTQQLHKRELIAARDVDNARNQLNIAAAQAAGARTLAAQYPDQVRSADAQYTSDLAAVRAAEAQIKQREAALGLVQKRLGDTTVRAPLAGHVAKRHVSAGEYVKENTALFTIVVANPLKYVGTVPERQAPELKIGQSVRLSVEAFGERVFTGTVTRIAPIVDVTTRTLTVEARVPNGDGALRPGFFAKGGVLIRQDSAAVFVPSEAVTSIAGITKVFVVADGKAVEKLVRPGARQGTWVEIPEGLKAGESVAVTNLTALFNGAPVELAPARQ